MLKGSEDFFEGLEIVSFNGKQYVINNVKKVSNAGRIKGLGLFRLFGLRQIKIEPHFKENNSDRTNSDLKSVIMEIIEKDREYWDSDGRLNLLMSSLKNSSSIQETISLMQKRYFNEPF